MKKNSPINDLLNVMARLRSPTGCPWDREQDHQSIRRHAIEEVYEPYLIQLGFLNRTPRGRVATSQAFEYFNVKRKPGNDEQPGLF